MNQLITNHPRALRDRKCPKPLPIEKKLIGWSIGAGLALLAPLIIVNRFVPLN
jgi:hypothetical protein